MSLQGGLPRHFPAPANALPFLTPSPMLINRSLLLAPEPEWRKSLARVRKPRVKLREGEFDDRNCQYQLRSSAIRRGQKRSRPEARLSAAAKAVVLPIHLQKKCKRLRARRFVL